MHAGVEANGLVGLQRHQTAERTTKGCNLNLNFSTHGTWVLLGVISHPIYNQRLFLVPLIGGIGDIKTPQLAGRMLLIIPLIYCQLGDDCG